jgi:VWFA-related protein
MIRVSVWLIGGLALVVAAPGARMAAQQPPPPQIQPQVQTAKPDIPAFRSRVTLVPLDVRVLDVNGKPVTDLTQDDFTIYEKGERQAISHFWASGLVPEASPAESRPGFRQAPGDQLTPQRGRTFLLVVGRGRIQQPFDGIGALITFVREHLLPQDRVAVMAYHRATDFTSDREKVVALLQRINDRHERIEALLQQYASGENLKYAKCRPCLPESLLPEINKVFLWPGAITSREMPQALGLDEALYGGKERRFYDALLETELAKARDRGFHTLADEAAANLAALAGSDSSTSYQMKRYEVWQDRDKLLNGISEMRYFEGEKHLVFVSEQGILLETREEDVIIARAASDARIALHTIVSGGIPAATIVGKLTDGRVYTGPIDTTIPVGAPIDLVPGMVMKNIAAESGGTSSITKYPRDALAAIDEITRFEYLLGYYPTSSARDGKFRDVKVRVNRADVRVLVRGGYFDEDVIIPGDRAAFLAHQRIASVGKNRDLIVDLPVTLKVARAKATAGAAQGDVMVDMRIDLARVVFELLDGRHVGSLEFRIYCGDPKEKTVGELLGTMRLNLSEASYTRYARDGIPYTARVPVKAAPKTVKVIVYDPASDLAGSAVAQVK